MAIKKLWVLWIKLRSCWYEFPRWNGSSGPQLWLECPSRALGKLWRASCGGDTSSSGKAEGTGWSLQGLALSERPFDFLLCIGQGLTILWHKLKSSIWSFQHGKFIHVSVFVMAGIRGWQGRGGSLWGSSQIQEEEKKEEENRRGGCSWGSGKTNKLNASRWLPRKC